MTVIASFSTEKMLCPYFTLIFNHHLTAENATTHNFNAIQEVKMLKLMRLNQILHNLTSDSNIVSEFQIFNLHQKLV